jgi:hypothetical protein
LGTIQNRFPSRIWGEEPGSTTNGNDKSFSRRGFCWRICYYYAEIKQLEGISPQRQMSYFVKSLNMDLRESTFAGHPKNLSEAIELARDAENIYISLPGQQNMGKQETSLQRSVQDLWSTQRAGGIRVNAMKPAMNSASTGINNQNGNIGKGVNTAVQDRPCPACDEMSHIPRYCRNRQNQYFPCCKFWKRHRFECHRILTLYLFRTITLLLKIRYGWREWTLTKSTIMMNQICKNFIMLMRKLTWNVQKPLTRNDIVLTRKTRRKRTRKYMQKSELVKDVAVPKRKIELLKPRDVK